MDLDFDKVFKIPSMALKFNRSHPYLKRNKKWLLQISLLYFFFSLVFFLIMYNLICHDFQINNFSQICRDGVFAIVFLVDAMQFFVLIYHKKSILNLINYVKKDYDLSKNFTLDEQIIVQNYANHGLYVCKLWQVLATAGFFAFHVKHIYLLIYTYFTDEFKLLPLYEFIYPEIIENNKNNIFIYILIYIYLNFAGFYAAVTYLAYVPLGPIMILHACGQLELVRTRIENLFVCEEVNEVVIRKKIKYIVQHLQYVHSFVNIIMGIFKIPYDLTLKATTLVVPFTMYEALEALNHGEFSFDFTTLTIASTLISTSPCYYSQLLMDKGEAVRMSIYSCGWELHYDRRTRTSLQILLLYGLRPIALRTIFKTLCLEAITDLFQQSYTIFNFMNAVWK